MSTDTACSMHWYPDQVSVLDSSETYQLVVDPNLLVPSGVYLYLIANPDCPSLQYYNQFSNGASAMDMDPNDDTA